MHKILLSDHQVWSWAARGYKVADAPLSVGKPGTECEDTEIMKYIWSYYRHCQILYGANSSHQNAAI